MLKQARKSKSEEVPIIVDAVNRTLDLPHKGITIRTLQAAAAANSPPGSRPRWSLVYKGTVIGQIRLHTVEGSKDAH